ncbi:hypothetical protein CRE_10350 [Caenorhabditis remanei]|uniref:Reverse transcriptase domain-containing protein n=1 Tax=Caenorhabditis remanei TaxID=31234 RepID=E3MQH5_CAERE|nr:hypothetical protein CRE_10350 [Caenorhabditis remanei]
MIPAPIAVVLPQTYGAEIPNRIPINVAIKLLEKRNRETAGFKAKLLAFMRQLARPITATGLVVVALFFFKKRAHNTTHGLDGHCLPNSFYNNFRSRRHGASAHDSQSEATATQLCLAIADLYIQVPTWTNWIFELLNQCQTLEGDRTIMTLTLLQVFPEEVENIRGIGENRRIAIREELAGCEQPMITFLSHVLEKFHANADMLKRVFKCLESNLQNHQMRKDYFATSPLKFRAKNCRFQTILGKVADLIRDVGVDRKKKEKDVEEEKPPKVNSKGIQKNLDFNVKLRNILTKAVALGELDEAVKEVLELLKTRNGELMLLDADPSLLQTKEKLDALKAITGGTSEGSTNQSDMTSLLLLSNMSGGSNRNGGLHMEKAMEVLVKTVAKDTGTQEMSREASSASSVHSLDIMPRIVSKEGMSFPERLSEAIEFWGNICSSEWVLSVIEDGYIIQLDPRVTLPEPQGLRPSVLRHKEFLFAEIERLEEEGVLERSDRLPRAVSPLHVVEQGKKKRMILDLSELNKSLVPPRFKLENMKTAWPFLENANFAATFDFKSGYHHIKIHRDSRDLLSFSLSNPPAAPYFFFKGLPFGLATAPWLFTKIFKVLVRKWRAEGIKMFLYLDDGLIVGETEYEVARASRRVRGDLAEAGVCVAEEKSFWVPDAKFTWLGYECDLVAREVRGTEKRMATWQSVLDELRRSVAPSVLDRMKFLGCLASFELVADILSLDRPASTYSSTFREPKGWDLLEGVKRSFIEELQTKVGSEFLPHIETLKAVPFDSKAMSTAKAYKEENEKRNLWIAQRNLPVDESSLLLYLVDKAKRIGSSALTRISAAYQTANESLSTIGSSFVSDLIRSKRREEIQSRKKMVEVTVEDVSKIVELAMKEDSPAKDRDALLAVLSFNVMLRASEAAEIKWSGVKQKDGMMEVFVEKAKNDQLGLGRHSYFNYEPGSDTDILMCRWRLRTKGKCPYVFSNLDGSVKLSAQSISALSTKMLRAIGKPGATHHCFRRGGANHMSGHSMEEIQTRGRWRSLVGLQRYIKDVPRAQGCSHPQEMLEDQVEDDEEFEYNK